MPITPEHKRAIVSKLIQSAAGNAPKPFGRNMPTSQLSNANTQHRSSAKKQYDSTVSRRTITLQLCSYTRQIAENTTYDWYVSLLKLCRNSRAALVKAN
jgi:hypothetical protein